MALPLTSAGGRVVLELRINPPPGLGPSLVQETDMTEARLVPKEKRDLLEVLAVGTKANVCHVLLTGQLETVYTPGSKCAEFILVGVNFAAEFFGFKVFFKLHLQSGLN